MDGQLLWGPGKIWNYGRDPFNQTFRKFRSKTQWIGSVQPEKFRKNGSTFWGGPLFPVGPVGILVEWIAPVQLLFLGMCTAKGFGSWVQKTPSHNPTQHEKRLLTAGLVPDSLISLSFPFPWNDLGLLALHQQELTVISLTAYNIT